MDTDDVRKIADLAESMRSAAPLQKDAEATVLIDHLIASQPGAVYFLVHTVLLQRTALDRAATAPGTASAGSAAGAAAVAEETGDRRRGLGGLFGGRRAETSVSAPAAPAASPAASGGSFLKTAAVGAAGVAGGVLLAQGSTGLFSGGAEHSTDAGATGHGGYDDWSDA